MDSAVEATGHVEECSSADLGNESVPRRPLVYVWLCLDDGKSGFREEIPNAHGTPAVEVAIVIIRLIRV